MIKGKLNLLSIHKFYTSLIHEKKTYELLFSYFDQLIIIFKLLFIITLYFYQFTIPISACNNINGVLSDEITTITVDQSGKGNFTKVQDAINFIPANNSRWIRIHVGVGFYKAIECESSKVAYTITVSQSSKANFTTIKDAVKFIPSSNKQWVKILLKPGTYKEKIKIPQDKGCIILEGSDRRTTTITFGDRFTSVDSVTFSVLSDNFIAKGVTFENSFNKASKSPIFAAIAFGSFGDKHAFYSCGFVGYQDTLWDAHGRHYFNSCYIEGAADFIWGNGQSIYEKTAINATGDGFITAQGRVSANESTGYVFKGCDVSGTGHVALGRAYRPFSRVIFVDSTFSKVVKPEGWFIWNQNGHENDVTYAEVNCKGPGADMSKRVPWEKKLDSSEVLKYTTQAFINQDEWIAEAPL